MGHPVRALGFGAAWAVALASCSVPTDKSKDILVVVRLSDSLAARGVLGQGARDSVFAVAIRQSTGDTVRNVDFDWSSDNKAVLTVQGSVSGSAEITGVNTGTAAIHASAKAFQDAQAGQAAVRVAPAFVIDSVRPLSVRYGQKVTVYGVGVPSLFALDLGFTDLIRDEFSLVGSDVGLGAQDYWVPAPSFTDKPQYGLFSGGQLIFGQVNDSITVDPHDILEPSDSSPGLIDLNGPGGPRTFGVDPVLFFNPALFFEPPLYFYSEDWYQFARSDQTTPLSFLLEQDGLTDTGFVYLADSIAWGGGGGYQILPGTSMISNAGLYVCDGNAFFTNASRTIRTVFPLVRPWSPTLQLLAAIQGGSVGYGLEVVKGYVSDPRLRRDRFETDDLWCKYADQRFAASNDSTSANRLHIVVGLPAFGQNGPWLDSTLVIERPGDIDWIRFRVQPAILGPDTLTTIQTKSLPLGPSDQSDIDVYIMRASDFAFMGSSLAVGSSEGLTLPLAAGDYYLGVVDVAGVATRYSVCIAKAATCTPPGSAPAAVIAQSVRRLPPRVARDPRQWPPGFTGPVRRLP
ncbi:MAG TPA: hypothetical protein VKO86_03870 [Gemmatimonadales bacterium]|nr:hypothetical protein [Gemmatimonadales bacterium]